MWVELGWGEYKVTNVQLVGRKVRKGVYDSSVW